MSIKKKILNLIMDEKTSHLGTAKRILELFKDEMPEVGEMQTTKDPDYVEGKSRGIVLGRGEYRTELLNKLEGK